MLTKISVKNLGCFDSTGCTVDLSQQTLIAGTNNVGKSMLFAGLNLARMAHINVGGMTWNSDLYHLVGFTECSHRHESKPIEISFTMTENNTETTYNTTVKGGIERVSINGQAIFGGQVERYKNMLSKVWCLHPNRSFIPYNSPIQNNNSSLQPLSPNGSNVINFLLERWTDQDPNWSKAEEWLRKIDPDMGRLKTPIRGNQAYLETTIGSTNVNLSLQGSGFQNAATLIAAIVFSPENSTIIMEEPEAFLHPSSQEVMVDLINDAVNNHNKQMIFTTHSWNVLLPFYNDCGREANRVNRGNGHIRADPAKLSLLLGQRTNGVSTFTPYNLANKSFTDFKQDFKMLWG